MQKRAGFTLIELVIVLAILGILAGIAIPRFMEAQAAARGARIVADLRTMDSALVQYQVHNTLTSKKTEDAIDPQILVPTYMASIPTPPSGTVTFPNTEVGTVILPSDVKYMIHLHSGVTNILQASLTNKAGAYYWTVDELAAR